MLSRVGDKRAYRKAQKRLRGTLSGSDWDRLRKDGRLKSALAKMGLLAADRAQDVYGKAGTWTEAAMADSGFSGPWAELASSHRLPAPVDRMAMDYAARSLPKDMYQPPQRRELTLGDAACSLRWIQCRPDELADACCDALLELVYDPSLPREEPLVFLCQSTEAGQAVVQRLEAMHLSCQHTFGADEAERRQQKMSFSASPGGPARVRATTVYSFKGWEASRLVLAIGRFGSARDRFAVYAGLTRVKDSPQGSTLSVVCAAPGHLLSVSTAIFWRASLEPSFAIAATASKPFAVCSSAISDSTV